MLDSTQVEERLAHVRNYADSVGLRHQLEARLEYLDHYAEGDDRGRTRCRLYSDFAPHSFAFVMELRQPDGRYECWFNGGLIFHGPTDGGAPNYSVSLTPHHGWLVHT